MIVRSKPLYEETAKKRNLPIDLIESVGNCVFNELRSKLDAPSEIAYDLPKFGTFNARFKMFEKFYENFLKQLNAEIPEALKKRDANPDLFYRATKMYSQMQEFRKKKAEVKNERNAESKDNS